MAKEAKIGVINISDRASKGIYEDIPGKACVELLRKWLISTFSVEYAIIPDEQAVIESTLIEFADLKECSLIVTTGGTGPAPRDVTPEATEAVCQKMLPGFGEQMRAESLKFVATAILSRQTAGIRGQSLILNLPGKPKAIEENLSAVFPAIPYCIDLIGGCYFKTDSEIMPAFRPKKS
ncbi:molybdopterin adenylyltransferase [Puniceicoccaceae bacterium K14]|nr:molybdopterin adenylyltransferase [Puniceicoccaceae bacterium K14]